MSHLTQMAGLAVQNFVSAAVGMAVAIALVRGLVRRRSATHRQLLGRPDPDGHPDPAAARLRRRAGAREPGRGPEPRRVHRRPRPLEGATQVIPGGPLASQEAIKELGTNGGGFLNANSAHPFENPNGFTNLLQLFLILLIPFALTYTFGSWPRTAAGLGRLRAPCSCCGSPCRALAMAFETGGNPVLDALGVDQARGGRAAAAATWRARRSASGPAASGLFAATTTGTSTGAVNSRPRQLHARRRRGAARQHDARRGQPRAASAPASTGCWSSPSWRCSSPA